VDGPAVVTISFLTLAAAQVWHVFNVVEPRRSIINNEVTRNPYVWLAIGICIGLLALACYLPPRAGVLQISAPAVAGFGVVLSASLLSMLVGRVVAVGLSIGIPTDAHRKGAQAVQ
jgi:Ca2+-transporting ATPase